MTQVTVDSIDKVAEALAVKSLGTTAPEVESLDDLDKLLEESMELQAARKRKNSGARLSQDDENAIYRARLAEEAARWTQIAVVTHTVFVKCTCGREYQEGQLRGIYRLYQDRKDPSCNRLERVEGKYEGPCINYTTHEKVFNCTACVQIGWSACPIEFPILKSLGAQAVEMLEEHPINEELEEDGDLPESVEDYFSDADYAAIEDPRDESF